MVKPKVPPHPVGLAPPPSSDVSTVQLPENSPSPMFEFTVILALPPGDILFPEKISESPLMFLDQPECSVPVH
jgi:hypothetical protein